MMRGQVAARHDYMPFGEEVFAGTGAGQRLRITAETTRLRRFSCGCGSLLGAAVPFYLRKSSTFPRGDRI